MFQQQRVTDAVIGTNYIMRIRMLQDKRFAPDGIKGKNFKEGDIVECDHNIAKSLIERDIAEDTMQNEAVTRRADMMDAIATIDPSPELLAILEKPENKGKAVHFKPVQIKAGLLGDPEKLGRKIVNGAYIYKHSEKYYVFPNKATLDEFIKLMG